EVGARQVPVTITPHDQMTWAATAWTELLPYPRRFHSASSGWVLPAMSVARARTTSGPASSSDVSNSHHCHPPRRGSPTIRASCQGPPFRLTSTLAMLAAPDQATPRIAVSPRGSFIPDAGATISARTFSNVTGSRSSRPSLTHSYQYLAV